MARKRRNPPKIVWFGMGTLTIAGGILGFLAFTKYQKKQKIIQEGVRIYNAGGAEALENYTLKLRNARIVVPTELDDLKIGEPVKGIKVTTQPAK